LDWISTALSTLSSTAEGVNDVGATGNMPSVRSCNSITSATVPDPDATEQQPGGQGADRRAVGWLMVLASSPSERRRVPYCTTSVTFVVFVVAAGSLPTALIFTVYVPVGVRELVEIVS